MVVPLERKVSWNLNIFSGYMWLLISLIVLLMCLQSSVSLYQLLKRLQDANKGSLESLGLPHVDLKKLEHLMDESWKDKKMEGLLIKHVKECLHSLGLTEQEFEELMRKKAHMSEDEAIEWLKQHNN
ncbi:Hypothetical predicted protein [Xyrichtys novacula]|uniref:Uncharacterized protein n=1 Tax=Xyrichtys novacula TaxID=13765 RepID=A0AAV1ERR0_XYRNO|nr:Hypothetical predicted protein [Xyrichtys novacula]